MASKASKKRVIACQEKAQKLIGLISSPKMKRQFDLTELTMILKFACNTISNYVKIKGKERSPIADEGLVLEHSFKQLDDILCKNTEVKFFMRKKMDHLIAQIYQEVAKIHVAPQMKKKESKKHLKENETKFTSPIKDEEGREFWCNNFEQKLMIPWLDFLNALQKEIHIDNGIEKQLHYVLDNSNTGFLSIYKFAEFLQEFGPLKSCYLHLHNVLSKEYFHGFLSHEEATKLLEHKQPTSFLVRFSKSQPGFALSYVEKNGNISHTHIANVGPSTYKVEQHLFGTKTFSSIQEVINSFPGFEIPVKSDFTRQEWFHGDLSNQEADEVLSGEKDGTFLFRFCSKPACLAVSYVQGSEIKHSYIECLSNDSFRYENQSTVPNLEKLISSLPAILKYPLKNLTFLEPVKPDNNNSSVGFPRDIQEPLYALAIPPSQPTTNPGKIISTIHTDPESGYMVLPTLTDARLIDPVVLTIASPSKGQSTQLPNLGAYHIIPTGIHRETDPKKMSSANASIAYGPLDITKSRETSESVSMTSPPPVVGSEYDKLPVHMSADGTKATPPSKLESENLPTTPQCLKNLQSFPTSPLREQASPSANYAEIPVMKPGYAGNYSVMPQSNTPKRNSTTATEPESQGKPYSPIPPQSVGLPTNYAPMTPSPVTSPSKPSYQVMPTSSQN